MTNERAQGIIRTLTKVIAVCIALFHLANVSGLIMVSDMELRAVHVSAMLTIMFLNIPVAKIPFKKGIFAFRSVGAAISIAICGYLLIRWEDIIASGGVTNQMDIYTGIAMVILLLFCTWISLGKVLSIIITVFLAYPFLGQYLPGILNSRPFSVSRVFSFLFPSTQAIYGIPTSVSASYIIIFCIYGAFLNEFQVSEFLFKLSASLTKKMVAVTAKTAIVFSALVGMISGSAAGNVAIAGSIAIPMMKKRGYDGKTAGAIEAVAATGGQIMPPVMGAAAFIMAEMTGTKYASIMRAAAIPAALYFLSLVFIVHFTACKNKIDFGAAEEENYSFVQVVRESWYLALPIILLLVMLVLGYSPFKSAYYSILVLLAVYLIANLRKKGFKDFIRRVLESLKQGAIDTVPIAIACAASGIVVGIINMTGIGNKLTTLIVAVSGGQLLVALILTMIVSIILGMGLPTTAVYLVVATVVAPALVEMGVSVLAAHLFVFFFGCVSTITPPVALASYVAAGIADASVNEVGWTGFRYGLISFILPFMFIFSPGLLMEGEVSTIIRTTVFAVIGVYLVSVCIVGHWHQMRVPAAFRVLLFGAGILLVDQGWVTDLIGITIAVMIFAAMIMKKKRAGKMEEHVI
jgi:TRAP transporter 4TM/12TM fusion protein